MNQKFWFSFGYWQALCICVFMIMVISPKIKWKVEDDPIARKKGETDMNIFYIIGVIVVVLFIAGFLGLR